MSNWTEGAGLGALEEDTRRRLATLAPQKVPRGQVLFQPGEAAKGFVIVLSGRIEVALTGPTGREIVLYAVEPGQTCVQTTLGLLGGADYTADAEAVTDCTVVLVPGRMFLDLMDTSQAFRKYVFSAFAGRVQSLMSVLERVAFQKVESRLASVLLDCARDGIARVTHQELANRAGTAREVVSRRLEALARRGLVALDRGVVEIRDAPALAALAQIDAPFVT